MAKEGMGLEELVEYHTKRHKRVKHYSRQVTMALALVCLVFFGTILLWNHGETTANKLTGMATAVGESSPVAAVGNTATGFGSFVQTVRSSPHVTEYKLFFYTMWIFVVLIGSAVHFEVTRKR